MKQIPVGPRGHFALVDDEDYEDLMQFVWHRKGRSNRKTFYAERVWRENGRYLRQSMHQRITGFNQTDHINGDGLDNRRSNLRPANHSQNGANKPKQNGNYSSRYKGVTLHKASGKWISQIRVNKKLIRLGTFAEEIMAAKTYDLAAVKYFGEFAYLNFPN